MNPSEGFVPSVDDDAPVLHDGDERHASLVLLPEELLNVELGIGGERLAQVARDEARDFRRGRSGRHVHARDQIHERATLQREHGGEKQHEPNRDPPIEALVPLRHRQTCSRRPTQ